MQGTGVSHPLRIEVEYTLDYSGPVQKHCLHSYVLSVHSPFLGVF